MNQTPLRRKKAEFWSKHIAQGDRDPRGINAYCQSHGLLPQTFYNWRRRLRSKSGVGLELPEARVGNPFLEVAVRQAEVICKPSMPDPKWAAEFVLHLLGGVR